MTPNTLFWGANVNRVSQVLGYKSEFYRIRLIHAYDEMKKNCRTTLMRLFNEQLEN